MIFEILSFKSMVFDSRVDKETLYMNEYILEACKPQTQIPENKLLAEYFAKAFLSVAGTHVYSEFSFGSVMLLIRIDEK